MHHLGLSFDMHFLHLMFFISAMGSSHPFCLWRKYKILIPGISDEVIYNEIINYWFDISNEICGVIIIVTCMICSDWVWEVKHPVGLRTIRFLTIISIKFKTIIRYSIIVTKHTSRFPNAPSLMSDILKCHIKRIYNFIGYDSYQEVLIYKSTCGRILLKQLKITW